MAVEFYYAQHNWLRKYLAGLGVSNNTKRNPTLETLNYEAFRFIFLIPHSFFQIWDSDIYL